MGNVAVHGVEQWERRDGFELMARQGNEEREREREREREEVRQQQQQQQ